MQNDKFIAKTYTKPQGIMHINQHIINQIMKYLNELTGDTIVRLIEKIDKYTYTASDNTKIKLTFLGKGDEGTVYDYNNMIAVKFFVNNKNSEIKFLEKLKKLYDKSITIQTLIMYGHFIKDNHLILLINKADGTIDKWMKQLNVSGKYIDIEWYHMMLQIIYGVLIIQKKLLTFHRDLLHRNILYKIFDKPIEIKYKLIYNNKRTIIKFTTRTIFYIADFGKSQTLLFENNNTMSDIDIMQNIKLNKDLYGLSTLYNKLFVDYIYHNIDHKKLFDLVKNDNKAKIMLDEIKHKMTEKAKIIAKPTHYIDLQVKRALCYYLIENKIIDIETLRHKIYFKMPSHDVRHILESCSDETSLITKMRKIRKQLRKLY